MKSHIVGTSIPENKPDADKKKRSIKAISELLAFGMLTNAMSSGGYMLDTEYEPLEEDDEDEAREFALSCLDIDIDDDAEMEKVKNIELVEYEK